MKQELNIIHAADLHLDSPFEALGSRAAQRRAEQRELLARLAELANERQADLMLLAGDLLDTGSAYAETGEVVCQALGQVRCPVFIAPGNHDYYSHFSPYARLALPENVHVFSKNELQCAQLPLLGARVWGAAFTDTSSRPLLRGVRVQKAEGVLDLCVLHGEVGVPDSRYNSISEQEVADSGMDYIALGHVHSFSGLRRAGRTAYAWPGCPEGRGFDECGVKGVLNIRLSTERCEAEFIPLCRRRYEILELDLSEGEPDSRLPEGTEEDIYRLVLRGACEQPPDTAALYERWKGRFFALQLRDRTTLRRDLWEHAGADDLRGVFLRRMKQKYDAAQSEAERELVTQAVRWALAALEGGEAVRPL